MIYPKELERKIGFDKIRELLTEQCISALGKEYVEKVNFNSNYEKVKTMLDQVREFQHLMREEDHFPTNDFFNVRPFLKKFRIEGYFLLAEEFHQLGKSLKTIFNIERFIKKREEEMPALSELLRFIELDETIVKWIDKVVDEKGQVRNNASPLLQNIRNSMHQANVRLRSKVEKILSKLQSNAQSPDDMSTTIRNGRIVIPVFAEYKRQVKGLIHDESATGQTVFMEPEELVDLNNLLMELEHEEKRELRRILIELTNEIAPFIDSLTRCYDFLGIIDFIRAKAKLGNKIEGIVPAFTKERVIEWNQAMHPLLYLAHQEQGKGIVPLDIAMDQDQRILVISGPNAGGKSVCMKTVALLQYMLQCGLPVPMREGSKAGLFKNIFVDIGDEQSIDNDLSTYSSHLRNMKYFVEMADKDTLFCIDEFGTGTDPQFGGAIAEAILHELNRQKSYGVITTHYANLKAYADKREGVKNASMRFDITELEPLYELQVGLPGSSYAIEIARKTGLPEFVLKNIRTNVGEKQLDYDRMLNELQTEKTIFEKQNRAVKLQNEKLQKAAEEYDELKAYLESSKSEFINEAKRKAKQIIEETNQKIERTIREIKENKAEKEATKKVREELAEFNKKTIGEVKIRQETTTIEVLAGPIEMGDAIRIKGQDTIGEVLSLREKEAEVLIGSLKSFVKINRLERISKKEYRKENRKKESSPSMDSMQINQRMADFSSTLDMRGKKPEEAFSILEKYVDDAVLLNIKEIKIIHGLGAGVLRQVVRNYLGRLPEVRSVNDEHPDRGGAGATIVRFS